MSQHPEHAELGRGPAAVEAITAGVLDVDRPWGHTRQLALNQVATVKCIALAPGQRVSLQVHEHRSELWQILDEPMLVQVGDEEWLAVPDELVVIPVGIPHRIANPTGNRQRFLEVCFGTFDEDDIRRLDDDYGR